MSKLTKTILKRPVAAIVSILALIIFGISSVTGFDLELTPEMNMPMMVIIARYADAGPEDVEELVTKVIEDNVGTLSGLDTVSSNSSEGQSMIMLSFEYGTDMDDMYIDVQKKVDQAKMRLPSDVEDIFILTMDSNSMENMRVSVTSEGTEDLLGFVEETVEPELEKITQVASIDVFGGSSQYISISVYPEYLIQYGISMNDIASAINAVNFTTPGGSAGHGDQRIDVSTEVKYDTVEELKKVPVSVGDRTIYLEDIAQVNYADQDPDSLSRYNGADNISIAITKNQDDSAVTLSDNVSDTIQRLQQEYPDIQFEITYDSSSTIKESIWSVAETLILGIILSMLVLFLFFGDLKGSFIVGCSMPVSLLVALILMKFMGYTLNMITMSALVIGIGMMVDNSIVVIEMCFRKKDEGMGFMEAAFAGTKAVIASIVASTITTVVVYLPLSLLEGMSGQMFSQLGFTIIFSITASLFSAITLVPLCFSRFCPIEKKGSVINRFLTALSDKYADVLRRLLGKKKTVALLAVLIFISSVYMAQFLKMELMADTDEGQISVSATFRSGQKLEKMDETARLIEDYLQQQPETESVSTTVSESSSNVSITAALKDDTDTNAMVDKWGREMLNYADGCEITVSSSSSMGMSGGNQGNSREFVFVGDNLDDLKEASDQVVEIMSHTSGVLSVEADLSETQTKAQISVDPMEADAMGFSAQFVAGEVYKTLSGLEAASLSIDGQDYSVMIEYPKGLYDEPEDLMNLSFTNAAGISVPLSEIADIVYTDTPQTIRREDGQYTTSITATMTEEDMERASGEIQEKINTTRFPGNVEQGINSMDQMMGEEFGALGGAIATAVFLVFMVMAIQFESIRYSLLVMFCIPFSLTGSFMLLLLTQCKLSMVSLIGFLMLAGIVVNNGIILVDTINQNRKIMKTEDALVEAGRSRLRPILMTTLTTILSMIPMAVGWGSNGAMMQGMAVVIIGGLTASTILTLVLLPTFYLIIYKRKATAKRSRKR